MRLTYILAVTIVATFHASATAFPSIKDSKAVIENGAMPALADSTLAESGRLLRRVDYDEDDFDDDDEDRDSFDEERGYRDSFKYIPAKPAKLAKLATKEKSAETKAALHYAAFKAMKERFGIY